MTGIERLRLVRANVPNTARGARKRLKAAASDFEAACLADSADWPLRFRLKAGALRAILTRHGGCDVTVDRLTSADVTVAVESLRLFCEEAELAIGSPGRSY